MATSLPDFRRAVADRAIALTGADWGVASDGEVSAEPHIPLSVRAVMIMK